MNLTLAAQLRRPEQFAVLIATGVIAIALAAIGGWRIGSVPLTAVLVGAVALQPITAIALILGAFGLAAAALGRRWTPSLVGVVLLFGCGVWLWADAAHHSLSLDLALFGDQVLAQKPLPIWPGRPSIISAVAIALFAVSLLGVNTGRKAARLLAVTTASVGALLASLSVLPYLLQDPSQLSVLHHSLRIALNTTVAVGALCVGMLIIMRDTGWVRIVAGGGERSRLARLLAPVALVPVSFGAVSNIGVRLGLYGPDVRMLLIVVLSACTLLFLALWAAEMLGREQRVREGLANALERSTVIVCTPDGVIQYWPRACEALYGWTAREAIGRVAGDLLAAETADNRAAIRAVLHRDGEWRGEQLHRTRTGEIRWVASHWVRQEGGPGAEDRMIGTVNDITEQKLVEASLRESRERLALAVSAYELGICDIDIRAGQLVAEEGLERIFGVPSGGLDGDPSRLRKMLVLEGLDDANRLGLASKVAGRSQQIDNARIRRPDGQVRDIHGVRRFFFSPEGEHLRTIGIYRDVTDERRTQAELTVRGERLAELRAELAHVSRLSAMGEMAAALAHELNQPLTAIGNSVGALKLMLGDGGKSLDDVTRERVVRAANQAEGQAVRAGEIVRRLRDFIARGEADARIERLGPLIDDALSLTLPDVKAAQIAVTLNLSPKADRVLADRIQIQQILVNLIRNATEAMRDAPAPHVLEIRTAVRRGMAEVSVADNGPGVSPELVERLFSPFQSTKNDGMGVGLSICRRIVEAHGGRMWLEDGQGGGADFRFTLPLTSKALSHAE